MESTNVEKIAIITDSCSDLSKEQQDEYNVCVLPLMIRCQDGEYRDSVDITVDEVYEKLKTEIPKTSTPSGEIIEEMFAKLKEEGYEKVLAIMVSGGISGTVNHVRLAAEDSGMETCVVNSLSGSVGHGSMTLQAAIWREEGMSFEELCEKVKQLCETTKVFFSIDTLEFLQKGGRIGKATAMVGTALNIKPVLSFDSEGVIYSPVKVRGRKLVAKKLVSMVEEYVNAPENAGKSYNLLVADGGAPEEREELEQKMKQLFPDYKNIFRTKVGATLGIYLGPGMLGAGIQFLND